MAGASNVDVAQFDMSVHGLRTAHVGASEQHVIEFNVYSTLKRQYAVAGKKVSDADLLADALRLKRDLERLQNARKADTTARKSALRRLFGSGRVPKNGRLGEDRTAASVASEDTDRSAASEASRLNE